MGYFFILRYSQLAHILHVFKMKYVSCFVTNRKKPGIRVPRISRLQFLRRNDQLKFGLIEYRVSRRSGIGSLALRASVLQGQLTGVLCVLGFVDCVFQLLKLFFYFYFEFFLSFFFYS